jgi:hypothetical protein
VHGTDSESEFGEVNKIMSFHRGCEPTNAPIVDTAPRPIPSRRIRSRLQHNAATKTFPRSDSVGVEDGRGGYYHAWVTLGFCSTNTRTDFRLEFLAREGAAEAVEGEFRSYVFLDDVVVFIGAGQVGWGICGSELIQVS